MAGQIAADQAILIWIVQEVGRSLDEATDALMRFVGEPADRSALSAARKPLAQVRGALELAGLRGAAARDPGDPLPAAGRRRGIVDLYREHRLPVHAVLRGSARLPVGAAARRAGATAQARLHSPGDARGARGSAARGAGPVLPRLQLAAAGAQRHGGARGGHCGGARATRALPAGHARLAARRRLRPGPHARSHRAGRRLAGERARAAAVVDRSRLSRSAGRAEHAAHQRYEARLRRHRSAAAPQRRRHDPGSRGSPARDALLPVHRAGGHRAHRSDQAAV